MATRSTPAKASLRDKDSGEVVTFHFNPKELQFSRKLNYQQDKNEKSDSVAMQFQGGSPPTITLNAIFDTYARKGPENGIDVRAYVQIIQRMAMLASKKKEGSDKVDPPTVIFTWGAIEFEAVITDLTTAFTLFTPAGVPVRANVTIALTITKEEEPKVPQNPTSRGFQGLSLYRVIEGDTLSGIAQNRYGDPTKWRVIAASNGIDRVRKLQAGLTLRLPDV